MATRRAPAGPSAPGRPSLAAVYLSVFIDTLGIAIIIPVLPYFVLQFTASVTTLGAVMTAYSGAQVLGAAAMGRFADSRGRKRFPFAPVHASHNQQILKQQEPHPQSSPRSHQRDL